MNFDETYYMVMLVQDDAGSWQCGAGGRGFPLEIYNSRIWEYDFDELDVVSNAIRQAFAFCDIGFISLVILKHEGLVYSNLLSNRS